MKGNPVIITKQLTRRFDDTTAVNELSLEVFSGEVFGVLGHNGAGKTTTVRLLNGVLTPSEGQVQVLGLSPMMDGPTLRQNTGVLTETPSIEERLTARENLTIYADLYGVPSTEVSHRVERMLEIFELADRVDEKAGGYSKGMKQRLALARALLHEPQLLFLDEPTAGLDPVASRQVRRLISQLSRERGRTVFLCTHNLIEAQQLCDRVAVLRHGCLIAIGTPADLARQMGGSLRMEIEVVPESTEVALEILRCHPDVSGVSSENGIITILGVAQEQIPDLVSVLVRDGLRLYRVAPQEPNLEDVYFALHGAQEETT
jgi:ABC-2 type transport system ATP-binding protein